MSLHSHTSSSQELLDFIPRLLSRVPLLSQFERAALRKYKQVHGTELDYRHIWWTPPLTAVEAFALERQQIEKLGLRPMVSLSDHDTIEGVWKLQSMESTREAVVSVEWSVPTPQQSVLHLGVHNIPPAQAHSIMAMLAGFTAQPEPHRLADILAELNSWPETLVVLNHPYWDEKWIGAEKHAAMVESFARQYRPFLHALELNGLRPWRENLQTVRLGLELGLPLISGGDRHGLEPNANINLTNARNFAEFAQEIRVGRSSDILFLPQYRTSLTLRVIETVCDVLRTNPDHPFGWAHWTDRVFRRTPDGVRSLSEEWIHGVRPPVIVRLFLASIRMADCHAVRSAMRVALGAKEEMVW
ncbi:MAG: hypothetical protein NZV14_12585 [Bryobacteraceae bacterium]|nr:hypothetical protein [Bryobacteraceae bacterium]MDW8378991.1 hypothetical protein [Bryobacterales bacterium]